MSKFKFLILLFRKVKSGIMSTKTNSIMLSTLLGLRTPRYVESLLILCLCFTVFTGCEKDDALQSTEDDASFISKRASSEQSYDGREPSSEDMDRLARGARQFDAKLSDWRKGADTRTVMLAEEASDNLEIVLNLKVASGVVYSDATTVIDSLEVSGGDTWDGGTIAKVYETAKTLLVNSTEGLRGENPGARYVSISNPKKARDGATRVYITASIGSMVQTNEPQLSSSHLVWGSANTTPASCTIAAEPEIATAVNFELDGCYVGNPVPPMGSCGFISIVKAGVNIYGGTVGVIPADLIYRNRDWPSNTPASNAPLFVNEGEFVWHQDNDQDEICFNFTKFSQYVINQVDVIEGPMLTDARALPGLITIGPFTFNVGPARRPMGEQLVSTEAIIFGNGNQIVDINAHFAFIDYGFRFFFATPIFNVQRMREL